MIFLICFLLTHFVTNIIKCPSKANLTSSIVLGGNSNYLLANEALVRWCIWFSKTPLFQLFHQIKNYLHFISWIYKRVIWFLGGRCCTLWNKIIVESSWLLFISLPYGNCVMPLRQLYFYAFKAVVLYLSSPFSFKPFSLFYLFTLSQC